jgi:hypothetical protein
VGQEWHAGSPLELGRPRAAPGVVYGFYSFQIVLFLFARLLGGKGSFGTRSYVQSLFYGPLALAQQVAATVPEVGGFLFAPVAAGSLIPTTTSLKAAHGCSGTRAVLTWVIPIVLNVVVVVGVVVLLSRGHRQARDARRGPREPGQGARPSPPRAGVRPTGVTSPGE